MPLNMSIGLRIEFYKGIVRFLCHSTAFLYRPTPPEPVQMLKLHKVYADYHGVIVTLVLSCTVSEILQVLVLLTSPLLTPILGVFPLHQIARVGVSVSRDLKQILFGQSQNFLREENSQK